MVVYNIRSTNILWIEIACSVVMVIASKIGSTETTLSNNSNIVKDDSASVTPLSVTELQHGSLNDNSTYTNMSHIIEMDDISFKENWWSGIGQYMDLPDSDATKQYILKFSEKHQRDMIADQLSYCPYTPLCNYSIHNNRSISCCKPCSCLPDCSDYLACCPDILSLSEEEKPKNMIKYCLPLTFRSGKAIQGYHVYGIRHCPTHTEFSLKTKCEQVYTKDKVALKDMVPVIHKETITVYRNVHCAICNGMSYDDVDFFGSYFSCGDLENEDKVEERNFVRYIKSSKHCDVTFVYRNGSMLRHCTNSISSCNQTGKWVQHDPFYVKACESYTSVITLDTGTYQNIYCALCNGVNTIPRRCTNTGSFTETHTMNTYGLSGILNFAEVKDERRPSANCKEGYLYDLNMDVCVTVRCSPYSQLVNGKCVTAIRQVSKTRYQLFLRLTPSSTHTLVEAEDMATDVLDQLQMFIKMLLHDDSVNICETKILLNTNITCQGDARQVNDSMHDSILNDYIAKITYSVQNYHDPNSQYEKLSIATNFSIQTLTADENVIIDINMVNGYKKEFDGGKGSQSDLIINDTELPLKRSTVFCSGISNTFNVLYFNSTISCDFTHGQTIPVASMTQCLLVEVTPSVYPWVLKSSGVVFTKQDVIFNHTHFYILEKNNTLFLCHEQYQVLLQNSAKSIPKSTLELAVSVVCVSLSIIALVLTLLTYATFKSLRSLPGKNILSLTVSLLVAQSSYLIGSFSGFEAGSILCKTFGVLTHFSFLQATFWMSISTFHMFKVLTKYKQNANKSSDKLFIFYNILSLSISTLFVLINVIVSSVSYGLPNIGYGASICYITSRKMIMATFAAPLLLVILSNMVMFILVMVTIRKTSAIKKNSTVERNDIVIFAKLSTLTGVTWIFGFIFTWTDVNVFAILFDVFSGGQGVFIFLSFVCNQRVLKMIHDRTHYSRTPTQPPQGLTTSRTLTSGTTIGRLSE